MTTTNRTITEITADLADLARLDDVELHAEHDRRTEASMADASNDDLFELCLATEAEMVRRGLVMA